MKWYEGVNNSNDVVISSRVRLARNLNDYAFPSRLDSEDSKKAALCIRQALDVNFPEALDFNEITSQHAKKLLLEEHFVSPDFCTDSHLYRALMTNQDKTLAVMINEEDHVRIQAIYPGFNLDCAYKTANEADDALNKGTNIAFDENLGFLTSCPTNLGTGMRASVMLHLPAMKRAGYIKSLINLMNKVGLCVRGLYGEGTEAVGCLYQLSNQITLGISETDTLDKLKNAVSQIVDKERELRSKLLTNASPEITDTLWRSYGTLKYAYKMTTTEAAQLISNVKLASDCGIIPELRDVNLVKLLIEIMPAHIIEKFSDAADSTERRDKYRADIIKQAL